MAAGVQITDQNQNNFGALRLLFAALVILSHSPELIDGDRSRELLTRLFGTLSFGEFAVDGFFLISGYLITGSLMRSKSYAVYLRHRILRIYPGYVAAYLASLLLGLLVAGGRFSGSATNEIAGHFYAIVTLKTPLMDGVFAGLPYPSLNGSMWTIESEFRCYLLTMALGALGLLANRRAVVLFTALLLALAMLDLQPTYWATNLLGDPHDDARFFSVFCCGASYYLFRDRVRFDGVFLAAAGAALFGLMFVKPLAEPALAVLGGYLLFGLAFSNLGDFVRRIGTRTDLSYGLYLYGWPIQSLLIWTMPGVSPWTVFAVTLITAALCGYLSWTFVESPFLRRKKPTTISTVALRATPAGS